MTNLLRNSDLSDVFEDRAKYLMVEEDAQPKLVAESGACSPKFWLFWFRYAEGTFSQPRGRFVGRADSGEMLDESPVYAHDVSFRRQDAGLLQAVSVAKGTKVRLTARAYAWSNHEKADSPHRFPHPDDPAWSEGAGFEPFFGLQGSLSGGYVDAVLGNITFSLGIDPEGGRNPLSDTVIWGDGAHIYNAFAQVPVVETTALRETITVFTRASNRFPFKHNVAYWDGVELVVVDDAIADPVGRGSARIQYERLYVLLPPGAGSEWAQAVIEATWNDHRYTVGGSADDAGIGDLDSRIVLAVNPERWGGRDTLRNFFAEHYPGVRYRSIRASSPTELVQVLMEQ